MARTRPYPPEYRQQIIELARAGRSAYELAQEFEPSIMGSGTQGAHIMFPQTPFEGAWK